MYYNYAKFNHLSAVERLSASRRVRYQRLDCNHGCGSKLLNNSMSYDTPTENKCRNSHHNASCHDMHVPNLTNIPPGLSIQCQLIL